MDTQPAPEPVTPPTAAPTPPVVSTLPEAKPVTAASLVSDDKDEFPASSGHVPGTEGLPGSGTPAPSGTGSPEVKRGRGRPPGSKSKTNKAPEANAKPDFSDVNGPAAQPKAEVKPVNYEAMAAMSFGMAAGAMANIFGPEWLPRPPQPGQPGEKEMMEMGIANWMRASEMPDIPPGMMLLLLVGMYAAPRFAVPNTKDKVKGLWYWIKSKFGKKKKIIIVPSPTAREKEVAKDDPTKTKIEQSDLPRAPDEWEDAA